MSSGKKNSILIVDDERTNIIALKTILSPDYTIYASSNGEEAIEAAEEFKPDIILLDIIMPEMDGYEVITALKNSKKMRDIPVVFITGLDSAEAEEKGLALGAADYITKPFHSAIVKMRVKNQIDLIERFRIEHDLNVVLKLQSELVAAKELAEHSSRAKSEFLSRMSHEMLTPMNAIMGMTEIIKNLGSNKDIKNYLDEINKASNDLQRLINDVLDISNVEYGTIKLSHSAFNISSLFKDLLETARYNASKKQQVINFNIDQTIPETVTGDEKRLKQVIENLLANAIKFTPENGEIYIESSVLDVNNKTITLQVTVSDNGIGIAKEQQDNLFDIFEQVDGSHTRAHGGIGLGLALSKRIIEMMDGKIWVESELNKGAAFHFTCSLQC